MLEYFYKEKRTLVDFRRGPLGQHFDDFAAHLKAKRYSLRSAVGVLGKCCQFNAFLIERRISSVAQLSDDLVNSFLEAYHAQSRTTGSKYSPKADARLSIQHLLNYLIEAKVFTPPKPKPVIRPYTWLLDPYLRYLRSELDLAERTITYRHRQLALFLGALGQRAARKRLKKLKAESVASFVKEYFRDSTACPNSLSTVLRQLFHYCAARGYTQTDFSGLIPRIRLYRHASLPKGMEDAALEKMLKAIPQDTPIGARDYSIIIVMMAYGIRGVSAATLLLEDIDWHHSRIHIRAQKGGKEVVVPLLDSVGEALIGYLRHRPAGTPFREVFLSARAPFRPLDCNAISRVVQKRLKRAGVKLPGSGARTLRHSWAIRALAHNSAIKSIADVLGHRYIDTTFIYAKANLNSLREVAMPWPGTK